MASVASQALGLFNIDMNEPYTEAQQRLMSEMSTFIRSFTINSKNPIGEQERLIEQFGITPSFFKGSTTMEKEINGIETAVTSMLKFNDFVANDVSFGDDVRMDAKYKAATIRNLLNNIGPKAGSAEDQAKTQALMEEKAQIEEAIRQIEESQGAIQ